MRDLYFKVSVFDKKYLFVNKYAEEWYLFLSSAFNNYYYLLFNTASDYQLNKTHIIWRSFLLINLSQDLTLLQFIE